MTKDSAFGGNDQITNRNQVKTAAQRNTTYGGNYRIQFLPHILRNCVHFMGTVQCNDSVSVFLFYNDRLIFHFLLSTIIRSSLPVLKKGTFLVSSFTCAPDFGFLPMRGFLSRIVKLPNPLISILSPFFNALVIESNIIFTA